MNGITVQNKVSQALARVSAGSRPVYFRSVEMAGGNSRLGTGTPNLVDVLVHPPPVVETITKDDVFTTGGLYNQGDYRLMFAGSTEETVLRNSLILYGDEILQPYQIEPTVIMNTIVCWVVVARNVKPAD